MGKRARLTSLLAAVAFAAACSPAQSGFDVGPEDASTTDGPTGLDGNTDAAPDRLDAGTDSSTDDAPDATGDDVVTLTDTGPSDVTLTTSVFVYAHTENELYQVNPRTFAIHSIALFTFPSDGGDHRMTDIAITGDDQMWGITFDTLYRVDTATANCTFAAHLAGGLMFNGLSYIPGATGAPERLVAAADTGEVYEIDRSTGAIHQFGAYGGGYGSSGDIVSVAGAGTFATVVDGNLFFPTEYLARIDETTGAATIIGPTGASQTWGLAYWGGTLYGFTNGGQLETIDVATGHATTISTSGAMWWGAGVTTRAPITHM